MTAVQTTFRIDGSGGDTLEEPANLYNPRGTIDTLPNLEAVDDRQVASYHDRGFLAVRGVLSAAQVRSGIDGIEDLISGKNPEFNGVYFEAAARDGLDKASARERLDKVRKIGWYVQFDERLNALAHDPAVLAAVSKLMGGATPRLFQDMALLKPPKIGREKPWHQDHAYFDMDIKDRIVGVWIALDEATIDNGCMQVLDGGHKPGPRLHWKRRDWQICDTEVLGKPSLACPLKPGGALFFDSLLPHGTPTNRSPQRRRAVQFHYCGATAEKVPKAQRLAIFGSDGKDVTC